MKRWVCPKCSTGVLAPERLARLDVRRWCLRCSAKSTTLIDLACLVHEVAHVVDRGRTGTHGTSFRALEAEAIGELVGAFVRAETIYYGPRAERTCRIAVQAWLGEPDPALHADERAEIIRDSRRGAYSSIHKPADAWPRQVTTTDGQIFNSTDGHTITVHSQANLDEAIAMGLRPCDLDECEHCAELAAAL